MIEGLLLARENGITFEDVASFSLKTNPRWLKVCDIKKPRTGLEVKFSYAWLAGMALRGDSTGAPNLYTDDLSQDAELSDFAEKVAITGDDTLTDLQAEGVLTLKSGETHLISFDLAKPLPLAVLEEKLKTKAQACLGGEGTRIWTEVDRLSQMSARQIGALVSG
jgi:hypothetical protein